MKLPPVVRGLLLRALDSRKSQRRDTTHFACGIFKCDRIGDFILAQGAIRRLAAHYGEERCVLLVSTLAESLARQLFPRATVLAVPLPPAGILTGALPLFFREQRRLGEVEMDQLACLRHQRSASQQLLLSWLRFDRGIGMQNEPRFRSPQDTAALSPALGEVLEYPADAPHGFSRELEANRRVVEATLGVPVAMEEVVPAITSELPHDPRRVLLCPFGSTPEREYPDSGWVEAARSIPESFEIRLCGAPAEADGLQRLQVALKSSGRSRVVIAETPDFTALLRETAQAALVLAVESAPAHLAIAMDKRGVFLIGGGHFGLFAPWYRSARQVWMAHPLPCFHCDWHCRYPEPYCITHIPPKAIRAAIEALLAPV